LQLLNMTTAPIAVPAMDFNIITFTRSNPAGPV
jgi:hypothetical protein